MIKTKNIGKLRDIARKEGAITKRGLINTVWLKKNKNDEGLLGKRVRFALNFRRK